MKRLTFTILMLALLLTACSSAPEATMSAVTLPDLQLSSPAFAPSAAIPAVYTCSGENISPALTWEAPPEGTQSLALIVDDPDAPVSSWVHWVVYNLPPDTTSLPEGASRANGDSFNLPAGAQQGLTSFKRADYGGPCPPSGKHHYFFNLYALDVMLQGEQLKRDELLEAMQGHILAQAELIGVYEK